jgi:glycosyltransferase involved in cell wall biosynthesis
MRIVHVLLTSRFAGTERHVLELAAAQAREHEVTLVLRRAAMRQAEDAIGHRVDPRVRVEVVGDLLAPWRARRVLRRLRPDVAHAHLSGACRAVRGVAGCLRVATLHIRYKARQHAHLDALVAIAPWQLAAIPDDLRGRSTQIDNWTVPRAPAPDARARLRAAHGIGDDAFLLGALGRVERSKGLDVLTDAFAAANPPGMRLAIVGAGGAWSALRARAPASVLMPGFVAAPQDWLAAFDGFASTARSEPFGLVLLEAMQAGLPIVASASEGASHLAPLIGRPLLPVGDVGATAAALRALASERPPRRGYDLAGYRLEDKVRQVEGFYRDALARLRKGQAA